MASTLRQSSKTTWVVVADEALATVYERKSRHGPLTELYEFENETEHKKTGDLLSDRGGRSFDSHGQGRHTMTREKAGPKQVVARAFAKQLAERIVRAVHDGRCEDVALIAAPRFLGFLRQALAHAGNIEPAVAIDKEMTGKDAAEIAQLLDSHE